MKEYKASPWELVQRGDYQDAIAIYSQLYEEKKSLPLIRNRATAYMLAKDFDAALHDYKFVLSQTESKYQGDGDFIRIGICYWYLNNPETTVDYWRQGLNKPYTDAAGGVQLPALMLYAAERLDDYDLRKESLKILQKHWQNHRRRVRRQKADQPISEDDFVHPGLAIWPGAIVPFLLRKADTKFLKTSVANARNDKLLERRRCAMQFYIGVDAYRNGNLSLYQSAMKESASNKSGILEDEYYLAGWEVDNQFPPVAFPTQLGR